MSRFAHLELLQCLRPGNTGPSTPTRTEGAPVPTEPRLRLPAEHEAHLYGQEPSRAGLLVTDELKKAITRCRNKVQELAAECRGKNRKFRYVCGLSDPVYHQTCLRTPS